VPSAGEELDLLVRERARRPLGADADCHLERRQRGAELVRDRRDEIVTQLVDPDEPRHVLQHDRHAGHRALRGA